MSNKNIKSIIEVNWEPDKVQISKEEYETLTSSSGSGFGTVKNIGVSLSEVHQLCIKELNDLHTTVINMKDGSTCYGFKKDGENWLILCDKPCRLQNSWTPTSNFAIQR